MKRVKIFTSNPDAARFAEFAHGDTAYSFEMLGPDGPRKLIEGQAQIFVDWVMPDLSGLEMCRRLRADARLQDAHVTMVLERDDSDDRRRALKAGADDYAVGPLDRTAMLDRVMALQPASAARTAGQVISAGGLHINVTGEQALWQGSLVPLRPNEFRVLRYMAENPNRVLTRKDLVDALGKAGDPDYLRTVDVWIKRLRFGLRGAGADHLLRTVHGKGYVLDLT